MTNARESFPLDRGAPPVDVVPAPLPTRIYSSEDQLRREFDTLWGEDWIFVAVRSELPATKGYRPVSVGDRSILLTVGGGQLRAFHNVCAHRGCELVTEAQSDRSTISCPYHAWVYGLDGRLRSARDFSGVGSMGVPPAGDPVTGLVEVAVDTWHDLIFVNLSPAPRPVEEALAAILERWGHVDFTSLELVATLTYDFAANWKLIVENFLESYHVPFLHHQLNEYSPATGRYQVQLANQINGVGTRPYEGVSLDGVSLPHWPSQSDLDYAEYFHGTTNFLLGIMPDHLFAWSLHPLSPDRTKEVLHFYFPAKSATQDRYTEHRRETLKRWRTVNDEDHEIVQRMHKGLTTGPYERARLSPVMEQNIVRFQNHIKGTVG